MTEANITALLLASLRAQSARFPTEFRDIEVALNALELRRAFTLMNRLKERGVWQPDSVAEQALEDFWWEYGQ
jgi:hypothetical protein